jgi:S-adenosylmethionine synthetase
MSKLDCDLTGENMIDTEKFMAMSTYFMSTNFMCDMIVDVLSAAKAGEMTDEDEQEFFVRLSQFIRQQAGYMQSAVGFDGDIADVLKCADDACEKIQQELDGQIEQ